MKTIDMKYFSNVVTLKYDWNKCNGCALCTIVCPHAVFEMENQKAVMANRDSCMECGACELNCSTGAIKVNSGVGCAAAIIEGVIKNTEPTCGCDTSGCC